MSILLGIAYFIGYEMQEHLSFLALVSIPLTCYHFWNKHINSKPHWLEYVVIFVGLFIFDKAQYKVDVERIIYLITSAVVIFVVCCWMAYKTKNILVPVLAFVIKRDIVINGNTERRMGVRNRYHTTIPCEYKFVLPTKMFSPFATCIKENRDSVVRSVEHGYVLE